MSDFIHCREFLNSGDIAQLISDTQCNFRLMDDTNFASFRRGGGCQYYGGFFTHFPARIAAPHAGHWNLVLDIAGRRASIRSNFSVIRR